MTTTAYQDIKSTLRKLYVEDARPWLVGFSGGKDSTMVASLVFDTVLSVPEEVRTKPISFVCTDTRVEIPAIVEMIEGTLARMKKFSQQQNLNIDVHLLKPPPEQSFWVNIIGRGYPPPNRTFRWCTQRMKIDPVTNFVNQRLGHWGEAILHLGARRNESSTRSQLMAGMETTNGLRRHPDLPRVWVSNPIEYLSTEEVWAYLLQKPNPWGGDNKPLYRLYAQAGGGECPIQIDTSTPSCGNSRFGCWTCTVVTRDKASEGLLASGDARMENLIEFRETLIEYRDPDNGKRDRRRMNGNEGPGPLTIAARRELLQRLLALQEETSLQLISPEELLLIQQMWKAARDPDDGRGVARIVNKQRGVIMNTDRKQLCRILIARYFTDPGERAALYDLVGLPVPPDDLVKADAKLYHEPRRQRREARFRLTLVPAYNYTCALTGYRCVTVGADSIVDAAHIHQFADSRNNHLQNGIALNKNTDWLFDQGLWSLADNYKVIFASERFDEASTAANLLKRIEGRQIVLPRKIHFGPNKANLAWYRKHVFRAKPSIRLTPCPGG